MFLCKLPQGIITIGSIQILHPPLFRYTVEQIVLSWDEKKKKISLQDLPKV